MSLYKSFVEKFSHIRLLHQIEALLSWDQQTYMPAGAVDIRAKQLTYIAGLAHKEATSNMYHDGLAQMIDIDTETIKLEGLSLMEQSNLKQWCRDLKKKLSYPKISLRSTMLPPLLQQKYGKKLDKLPIFLYLALGLKRL